MSNGPTHSNRTFKLMRTTTLSEGEYIIETWEGSNFDKETKQRTSVPGALDIKIYNKDTSKEYNKGDGLLGWDTQCNRFRLVFAHFVL